MKVALLTALSVSGFDPPLLRRTICRKEAQKGPECLHQSSHWPHLLFGLCYNRATYEFLGNCIEKNTDDGTRVVWKLQSTVVLEDQVFTPTLMAFWSLFLNFFLAIITKSIYHIIFMTMTQVGSKIKQKHTWQFLICYCWGLPRISSTVTVYFLVNFPKRSEE